MNVRAIIKKYKVTDNPPPAGAPCKLSPGGEQMNFQNHEKEAQNYTRGNRSMTFAMDSNPAVLQRSSCLNQVCLKLSKDRLDDPEEDEKKAMWSDETKINSLK